MKIIFENEQIIVCQKAAGEPVQSASFRMPDLVSRLKTHLREENPAGGEPYLGIIHRLDQPVQGLVVFAKTKNAAADLSKQVQDNRMEKWYYARVHPSEQLPSSGSMTDWLYKNPKENRSSVRESSAGGAKKARLTYEFLTEDVVRIRLDTGRHHQIRVQFAHAGAPLCGDHKYGREDEWKTPCLCAYHLSFLMPGTGKRVVFEMNEAEIAFLKSDNEG